MRRTLSSPTRTFFFTLLSTLLLTLISSSSFLSTTASAQSANCHACIRRVTPTITNCTGLTTTQLGTVDSVIHGVKLFAGIDDYLSKDPAGFRCVSAMMWDIVRYRGHLWSNCLNPTTACPWAEMMQYLTMIPKIASIYGAQNPPAAILVDPPK